MGREEIVRKACKWDSQRGKFTTFANRVLHNHYNRYFRDEQRHYGVPYLGENKSLPDWMANLPDPRASALPSRLWDIWESCSQSVKDVIEICLTTSLEDVYGEKFTLAGLKEELLKRGWDDQQIQIAVSELRSLIRDW
jgi:DNA-directed RNA polymerase specialized sigma24 family protein